jgi:hypothetical protein
MTKQTKNALKLTSLIVFLGLLVVVIKLWHDDANEIRITSFVYNDSETAKFQPHQKAAIQAITESTMASTRELLPQLSEAIQFTLHIVDRDLSIVNGVSGRADEVNEIQIEVSSTYQGGLDQAIQDGLASTLFHELHHTVRGWVIYDNQFGKGIDIAAINEGLADVFSEIQSGQPSDHYPNNVDFDAWTMEIMALPKNADYGEWMFALPDGREAVGYRTGGYLVKRAMERSGKDILELSKLSVSEIYELAGY